MEEIAICSEVGQQRVEPGLTGPPRRLRRDHAEAVVGGKTTRGNALIETLLERAIGGNAGTDVRAGEIEGFCRRHASDQPVRDFGCCGKGGRVPRAGKNEIAMDLVGDQDQVMPGAKSRQRADLLAPPYGPAGVVRAAEEDDL